MLMRGSGRGDGANAYAGSFRGDELRNGAGTDAGTGHGFMPAPFWHSGHSGHFHPPIGSGYDKGFDDDVDAA